MPTVPKAQVEGGGGREEPLEALYDLTHCWRNRRKLTCKDLCLKAKAKKIKKLPL